MNTRYSVRHSHAIEYLSNGKSGLFRFTVSRRKPTIIGDHEYFAGREQEEDDAARSATCIEGRICHQKLADAYRRRCEEIFAATNHNCFATPAGYPTTTRQPIVISNTPALTASPTATPRLVV